MICAMLCNPAMRDGRTPCFEILEEPEYGFRLKRVRFWEGDGKTGNILPWIALNPSGANKYGRGLSGLTMARLAYLWGFHGVATYNIVPYEGSKPEPVLRKISGPGEHCQQVQIAHERTAADLKDADALVVGWGSQGGRFGKLVENLARHLVDQINSHPDRASAPVKLWCADLNPDGTPKHAGARGKFKIPKDARPRKFDFQAACRKVGA